MPCLFYLPFRSRHNQLSSGKSSQLLKLKENFKKHYHPTGLIYIDESMNFVDELYYIPTVEEAQIWNKNYGIKKITLF